MAGKIIPYPRPFLEIEFDRELLTDSSKGDRFVPVVLRFCGLPEKERHAQLTVTAERLFWDASNVRTNKKNDPYDHRTQYVIPYRGIEFPRYQEYHLKILARPHSHETGTIHVEMFGARGMNSSPLARACFVFDSRYNEPVVENFESFPTHGLRFLPTIRNQEERNAFNGRFPGMLALPAEGMTPVTTDEVLQPSLL